MGYDFIFSEMKYVAAFFILAFIYLASRSIQKKDNFRFIKERHPDECGPTCLAMIAKHFGKEMPVDTLCEWMLVLPREGTSIRDIVFAGERLGLRVLPVKIPFGRNKSISIYNAPLPCILHWQGHYFVVLYKIRRYKFYIAHPKRGKLIFEKDEFKKKWVIPRSEAEEGIAILFELKK